MKENAVEPGNLFTFKRVVACQCASPEPMKVAAGGAEAAYFDNVGKGLMENLLEVYGEEVVVDKTLLTFESLTVRDIKFTQLVPLNERQSNETDEWLSRGPDVFNEPHSEKLFKVKSSASWDYTFSVRYDVETTDKQRIVVEVSLSKYGNRQRLPWHPPELKNMTYYLKAEFLKAYSGTLLQPMGNTLYAFNEMLKNDFSFRAWPATPLRPAAAPLAADDDEYQRDMEAAPVDLADHGTLFSNNTVDQQGKKILCYFKPPRKKDDDGKWIPMASFTMNKVLNIYHLSSQDAAPIYNVLCTVTLDPNFDTTVYGTLTNRNPPLNGYGKLCVEVLLPKAELTDKTLSLQFAKQHPYLEILRGEFDCKKLDAVLGWLQSTSSEKIQPETIVRWYGRMNKSSDVVVASNICYRRGEYVEHKDVGLSKLPGNTLDGMRQIEADEQCELIIMPQVWVRFHFHRLVWTQIAKIEFKNNHVAWMLTMGAAARMLHAHQIAHHTPGIASIVLYSPEGGSGKTNALQSVWNLMGYQHRKLAMGITTTPANLSNVIANDHFDQCVCFDEMTTMLHESDEKFKTTIHTTYGLSAREVYGKREVSKSGMAFTTNRIPFPKDATFQQRILIIPFEKLEQTAVDYANNMQWTAASRMLSCLQPDIENLVLEGHKIPLAAMQDCAMYMNEACNEKAARNPNSWGEVLLWTIYLDKMAGETGLASTIVDQCVAMARGQNKAASQNNSIMVQFLRNVHDVTTHLQPNKLAGVERSFHVHNMRMQPQGMHGFTRYIAIELSSACKVLATVVGRTALYTPEAIEMATKAGDMKDKCKMGKSLFYDVGVNGVEGMATRVFDPERCDSIAVPLEESALQSQMVVDKKCLLVAASYYHELKDGARIVYPDHTQIVITSAFDGKKINLYDCLVGSINWHGWAVFDDTEFGKYCGRRNMVIGYDEEVHDYMEQKYEMSLDRTMPSRLEQVYTSTYPDLSTSPWLKCNPYEFANLENDSADLQNDLLMPDDRYSKQLRDAIYFMRGAEGHDAPEEAEAELHKYDTAPRWSSGQINTAANPTVLGSTLPRWQEWDRLSEQSGGDDEDLQTSARADQVTSIPATPPCPPHSDQNWFCVYRLKKTTRLLRRTWTSSTTTSPTTRTTCTLTTSARHAARTPHPARPTAARVARRCTPPNALTA